MLQWQHLRDGAAERRICGKGLLESGFSITRVTIVTAQACGGENYSVRLWPHAMCTCGWVLEEVRKQRRVQGHTDGLICLYEYVTLQCTYLPIPTHAYVCV